MPKILIYPDTKKILRTRAKAVTAIDDQVKKLVQDLLAAVTPDPKDPKGVGLAANQIGRLQRVFIMMMPNQKIEPVINPEIIRVFPKLHSQVSSNNQFLEGCLSFPGLYGFVDRPIKIQVRYQNLSGKIITTTLNKPFSIYFQHERDHLGGILFIDYLKKSKNQMYRLDPKSGRLKPIPFPY